MQLISFVSENLGTIAVAAAVLWLVVFLVIKLVKDKRAGKSGCSSCPVKKQCPSQNNKR